MKKKSIGFSKCKILSQIKKNAISTNFEIILILHSIRGKTQNLKNAIIEKINKNGGEKKLLKKF